MDKLWLVFSLYFVSRLVAWLALQDLINRMRTLLDLADTLADGRHTIGELENAGVWTNIQSLDRSAANLWFFAVPLASWLNGWFVLGWLFKGRVLKAAAKEGIFGKSQSGTIRIYEDILRGIGVDNDYQPTGHMRGKLAALRTAKLFFFFI